MRTDTIRDIKKETVTPTLLSGLAKKTLCAVLSKMAFGRLTFVEQDETISFGESAETAFVSARIDIYDSRFYTQVMQNGMIGCADAYMKNYWSSPDLVGLIRVMVKNLETFDQADKPSFLKAIFLKIYDFLHINNLQGSKRNISAHYDLGNDFFSLFLDKTMMYSSAVFKHEHDDLDTAAVYKCELICQKLDLQASDHVIEIGTGWGALACHMAQHYGCKVTSTTLSQEQYDKAQERVSSLGLENQVTIILKDYRLLEGTYDKLVSVEMIEAVGHKYYKEYFNKCSALLKPNGLMLIQSILISDKRYDSARKSVDFIKRYIFPGGCLPSHSVISAHVAKNTDLQILQIEDITYDYAKTLEAWRERFMQVLPEVRQQGYTEEFIKMWDLYLCYCQGGFMERSIHTAQIVFAKPHWRDKRYPV